jgi:hypothetical protein
VSPEKAVYVYDYDHVPGLQDENGPESGMVVVVVVVVVVIVVVDLDLVVDLDVDMVVEVDGFSPHF